VHATWCWSAPNLSEIFSWHGVLSYRCWRMRWIACLFSTLILHRCWLSTTLVSMLSTSGASHHCTRLHRKAGRSSARCWWACFYFHCYIWIHILLLISTCFWSDSAVVQYYVSVDILKMKKLITRTAYAALAALCITERASIQLRLQPKPARLWPAAVQPLVALVCHFNQLCNHIPCECSYILVTCFS